MKQRIRYCLALIVLAACVAPAPAQQAEEEAASDGTYMFQVVILMAESEGQSDLENVPANAQKAIDDIIEFLPYRSYRLIDMALVHSRSSAEVLLNGPQGQDYVMRFDFRMANHDGTELDVRQFILHGDDRTKINTSFNADVGETIVVGTSKLNGGGKALVALFTAVK